MCSAIEHEEGPNTPRPISIPDGVHRYTPNEADENADEQYGAESILEYPGSGKTLINYMPGWHKVEVTRVGLSAAEINRIGELLYAADYTLSSLPPPDDPRRIPVWLSADSLVTEMHNLGVDTYYRNRSMPISIKRWKDNIKSLAEKSRELPESQK